MVEDDVQLIHRILSGDEEAFTDLVRKHQKSVHALAWRTIGDFHHAEEVMQDTFLQVYKKLSTLKDPRQFSGWLYVITHRRCLNWLRKNKSAIQSLETTTMEAFDKSAYSRYISEQREAESAEHRQNVVKKLLDKLPESERTVMTLYYLGEMKTKEISRFLGVSVNTITSRLHRARQRLQQEEELLVQEMFRSVQLSPNLIESITQKVANIKPAAQPTGKPVLPWAAFGTAFFLLVLLFGASNQYLTRFQKPYSFEAASEPTIAIIDAPIVLETDAKPALRNQAARDTALDKTTGAGLQDSETVSTTGLSGHPKNVEAWMPDPNLRRVISEWLNVETLTMEDMQRLHDLVSDSDGIKSLEGLQYGVNLNFLHIGRGLVSDLTPLAGLTNLETLKLYGHQISDISSLAELMSLRNLQLQANIISDLTPLMRHGELESLLLHENKINDISPLSNLTKLKHLDLAINQIDDFTHLLKLTNLTHLDIRNNPDSEVGHFVSSDPAIIEALRVRIYELEKTKVRGSGERTD